MNFFRLEEGLQMRMRHCRECCICLGIQMGLSENRLYSQWNSHLVGIMIINHWENGVHYFQTHPNAFRKGLPLKTFSPWLLGSSPNLEAFVGLQFSVAAIKDWWMGDNVWKSGDVSPNQQSRAEWWVSSCIFLLSRRRWVKIINPLFFKRNAGVNAKNDRFSASIDTSNSSGYNARPWRQGQSRSSRLFGQQPQPSRRWATQSAFPHLL